MCVNSTIIEEREDLFTENSRIQVIIEQGLLPKRHHPIVDMMSRRDLNLFIQHQESNIQLSLSNLHMHTQYIAHFMNQFEASRPR